jgi:ABC-type multidrug transport system ATPase subunit
MHHFIGINFQHIPGEFVLSNADFSVERGTIALIEGDNGSGKTTLMKYIGGLISDGAPLNDSVKIFLQENRRRFYYFPEDHLFRDFTVSEFLFLSCQFSSIRWGKQYRAFRSGSKKALEKSGKNYRPDMIIKQLSSGERTFLRFLNLYINDYDVLLLDEPSSHLDKEGVVKLISLIKQYVEEKNCYCLLSSHDPRLCNDVIFKQSHFRYQLQGGHIVKNWQDSTLEISRQATSPFACSN